ncbi:MAG: hypothetical protein ACPGNT_10235 [Rhodospirillales bacterium]
MMIHSFFPFRRFAVQPVLRLGLLAVGVHGLAACTSPEAYIYDPNEFNRESETFNQPLTDRDAVTICYSKSNTKPADLIAMARAECGKFGKTAVYESSNTLKCALVSPGSVTFACEGNGGAKATSRPSGQQTGSGQPAPADGPYVAPWNAPWTGPLSDPWTAPGPPIPNGR